jgi:predicted nucleotidyltransferase
MRTFLSEALQILRDHQTELNRRGVRHAAIFGSTARGESDVNSDIDILIDLDPDPPMGLIAYASLNLYLNDLLGGTADIANRKTLKPFLRDAITQDAIDAF